MEQKVKLIIIHPTNTDDEIFNKLDVTTIIDFELENYKYIKVIDVIRKLTSCKLIPNYLTAGDYKFLITEFGSETEIEESQNLVFCDTNKGLVIKVIPTYLAHGYFDEIVELWNAIYPYLDQVGTVMGIASGAIGFGMWIKSKFEKNTHLNNSLTKLLIKNFGMHMNLLLN